MVDGKSDKTYICVQYNSLLHQNVCNNNRTVWLINVAGKDCKHKSVEEIKTVNNAKFEEKKQQHIFTPVLLPLPSASAALKV